jgi:hypothetical protein
MDHLWTIILGFFSGAAGSLIAPWVNWGIEKKRDKIKARRSLISDARKFIRSKSFSAFDFSEETYFIQLKPFMNDAVIEHVEMFDDYFNAIDDSSTLPEGLKAELLQELHRIEQKWGLI